MATPIELGRAQRFLAKVDNIISTDLLFCPPISHDLENFSRRVIHHRGSSRRGYVSVMTPNGLGFGTTHRRSIVDEYENGHLTARYRITKPPDGYKATLFEKKRIRP
jgi:hypothetical protein